MVKQMTLCISFFAFLASLLAAVMASAATLIGRVVGVHDGDTITMLDTGHQQHKIRLAGIDAPELKQAFGTRSKQNLSSLIYGRQVMVEWDKHDRYGRISGKVLFTPDVCITPACVQDADVGYEQIATGFAWHYKQYAREQSHVDRARCAAGENQARAAKRGL